MRVHFFWGSSSAVIKIIVFGMQTPPKIAAYALSLFVFGLHSAFVVVCFLALLSFRLLCTCCGFVNGVNVIRIVIVYFSRPGSIASWNFIRQLAAGTADECRSKFRHIVVGNDISLIVQYNRDGPQFFATRTNVSQCDNYYDCGGYFALINIPATRRLN